MKKTLVMWVLVDKTTGTIWDSTISTSEQMSMAIGDELLSLDCLSLSDTNFVPVKCTIEIKVCE